MPRFVSTVNLPKCLERLPIDSGRARSIMDAPFDQASPSMVAHGRRWRLNQWKVIGSDLEVEWVDEKALRKACQLPIRIKLAVRIARIRAAIERRKLRKQQQRQDQLLDTALGESTPVGRRTIRHFSDGFIDDESAG